MTTASAQNRKKKPKAIDLEQDRNLCVQHRRRGSNHHHREQMQRERPRRVGMEEQNQKGGKSGFAVVRVAIVDHRTTCFRGYIG